jgi:hypothetical protein
MRPVYDVIGDIHGHADALERLLVELGYAERGGAWRHPERTAVFLGDFVDRGPAIVRVLEIVRPMVEEGAARAVMGNHELNAIAFHMPHPVENRAYLRERSYKNIRQYMETVRQLGDAKIDEATRWFLELPLWLDLGDLRVVHACWDPASMAVVEDGKARHGGLNEAFMHEACESSSELFEAVEVLLKGVEVPLPPGVSFHDKDGHERRHVRTKWYLDPGGLSWRDYAFAMRDDERARIPDEPVSDAVVARAAPYALDAPPVLFGHYWMPAELEPAPLVANAACLDYSVARGGRLCAYRWDGEAVLDGGRFVSVPASA